MAKLKKVNWKSKKTWKNILVIGLAVITLVGAIVGLSALFRKSEETTKEINPTYAIGGLTEQGAYLETKESIYTKDAFECQGLNVKLAFDNNISYRIFFYDIDDNFVNATGKLTTNYDEDISFAVKSARIVITPNEDNKVSWYEKNGYANQLTIRVDKEQKHYEMTENLWVDSSTMTTENFYGISVGCSADNVSTTSSVAFKSSALIDVAEYDKLVIVADFNKVSGVNFHTWSATKTLIKFSSLSLTSEDVQMSVNGNVATYIIDLDNSVSYVSFSNKVISSVGSAGAVIEVFGLK